MQYRLRSVTELGGVTPRSPGGELDTEGIRSGAKGTQLGIENTQLKISFWSKQPIAKK